MDSYEIVRELVMGFVDSSVQVEPFKEEDLKRDINDIVDKCEEMAMEIEAGNYSLSLSDQKDIHESMNPEV